MMHEYWCLVCHMPNIWHLTHLIGMLLIRLKRHLTNTLAMSLEKELQLKRLVTLKLRIKNFKFHGKKKKLFQIFS